MNKCIKWGLAALLVVGVVTVAGAFRAAQAQGQISVQNLLHWRRGISSYGLGADSLKISIPAGGPSVDFSDTTAWLELGSFHFTQVYSAQPIVLFNIRSQLTTGTDSVGYQVQWSNDGVTFEPQAVAYFTLPTAATNGVTAGDMGIGKTIAALAPTSSVWPYAYVRLVVKNAQVGSGTRKYFEVQPVVWADR